MRTRRWSLLTALAMALVTLSSFGPALAQQATPVTQETATHHGIDVADMDLSADPRQDFNRFANGSWLDRTEIPGDRSSMDTFQELTDQTNNFLIGLLQQLGEGGDLQQGSDEWKAVQIFNENLDLKTRNANGFDPIKPTLAEIDAIASLDQLHVFLQDSIFKGVPGLFPIQVYSGLEDSSVNEAYLFGPDVWLPSKDYYVDTDADTKRIQQKYVETLAELLGYAGYDAAKAKTQGQAVFDFEQTMEEQVLSREESQDFSKINHPMTVAELEKLYPLMDWQAYMSALGQPKVSHVLVTELRYMQALDGTVRSTPLATIKDDLKLQLLWNHRLWLGEDIQTTSFDFRARVLSGQTDQPPVEERALEMVNGVMGEAVGKLYVEQAFPPEAKQQTEELVQALLESFRLRLERNDWLAPSTKETALKKLANIGVKVGYPDKWRTYDQVSIEPSFDATMQSATNAEYRRQLAKVDKPVDRTEWGTPPQTVNAFYDPSNNDITFPAAILQPPFFDYQADPASNFGAIGWVIGHEITHGFDLQGSQFDENGNFASWWTDEDNARFQALNSRVVEQYGKIEALPGVFVDGQNTVTENVADMGGMRIAYEAMENELARNGRPGKIDGFTQEQRFFIAAATVWRAKERPELVQQLIQSDSHAPSAVRATQPARNTDAFFDVFRIKPGDAMYLAPADRITIW
jgi:putative endopeptidase